MRISSISAKQLFGIFDHTIPLNLGERITIIFGPNGYGKTYLLSAVNALFNGTFDDLLNIPFTEFRVGFDNGSTVILGRKGNDPAGSFALSLTDSFGEKKPIGRREFAETFGREIHVRFIQRDRLLYLSDTELDRPAIVLYAARMRELASEPDDSMREKIGLFTRIINSRLNHKKISVDSETGFAFATSAGAILSPEKLSSGEQHTVVILFNLLFDTEPDTLVMIDEPELSLHVFWQQQFISDLAEIIGIGRFDALIATHSPQIIHDRWDLAVELKGPGE